MLGILLIFSIALMPLLVSLVLLHQAKRRWQARLRQIRFQNGDRLRSRRDDPSALWQVQPLQPTAIGNVNCRYNARSAHLRCAVNPSGDCDDCCHYEPRQ